MSKAPSVKRNAAITVRVDVESHRHLAAIAKRNDVSVAWVVRRAIEKYLEGAKSGRSD